MNSMSMLNDENALNNINPFVTGGPGGWRKPYGFAPGVPDKDQVMCNSYGCSLPDSQNNLEEQRYFEKDVGHSPWEPVDTSSPLCEWGITAKSNGNIDAPSCRSPKNPESCPLSRPLEPTQEFIPDLYTLKVPVVVNKKQTQEEEDFFPVVGIVVMIGVLLMLVRR